MDSTSIVGTAQAAAPDYIRLPIRTFSGVTNEGDDAESRNIQLMINRKGLMASTVRPDQLQKL